MKVFTSYYNNVCGAIIALLTLIFGEHWFLFAVFIIKRNRLDYGLDEVKYQS